MNNLNTTSMQLNNKQELVPRPYWFVLVAILGLAIRLIGMGRQSLWLDEMTSIQVAGEPLYKILKGQVFDNFTPPLYYVLLHFWGSIVPLTETTLRLPSALIDFCNIFLLMALCRHYISRISTFVVVSAYAISPFMLYYAQEGRMYTLVVFFAMVYCLALERIVRTERHLMVWTAVSGVVLALGVYTHYYMAFFGVGVMSLALFMSRHSKKRVIALLLSGILGVLLFAPWIPILKQIAVSNGQTFRQFTFTVLPYTLFRFVVGYAVFPLNMHSKTNYWNEIVAHIPHLVIIFGSLLFILYNITISAKKKGWPFFASLAWIIVTPAFIGLLLSLKSPMLSERYLIAVLPFSLIFILGALDVMRLRGQLAILLFLGLLIIGDMAFFFNPQFGKAQWREAASYVSSTVGEDDVIMIEPDYVTPVFRYYFNGPQPVYPLSLKTIKIDSMSDESKALQSINQKHHIVLVSSGQTVETGYARVLMRVALKKDIRVFPLETGITCVKWDIINR